MYIYIYQYIYIYIYMYIYIHIIFAILHSCSAQALSHLRRGSRLEQRRDVGRPAPLQERPVHRGEHVAEREGERVALRRTAHLRNPSQPLYKLSLYHFTNFSQLLTHLQIRNQQGGVCNGTVRALGGLHVSFERATCPRAIDLKASAGTNLTTRRARRRTRTGRTSCEFRGANKL